MRFLRWLFGRPKPEAHDFRDLPPVTFQTSTPEDYDRVFDQDQVINP